MMMTEYFPISPLGEEPSAIEAFGSLFCRMAVAHSVSIYVMTTHLRKWWQRKNPLDNRAKINVINSLNPMFCGLGANVSAYLDIVSAATGSPDLIRTTFLPLGTALGSNGVGLVRDGRAWCPACHTDDLKSIGAVYDRLLWAIPFIGRCPTHKVALEVQCPVCSALQPRYHHLGSMHLCCRCKQSLRAPPSTWRHDPNPHLHEKECVQLVSELSSGQLVVAKDAWQIFIREFSTYMDAVGRKVSKYAYDAPRRPQIQREPMPPRFPTLIRRCTAFGINPVHLLTDPAGAAKSACMFEFARLDIPADRKPLRPPELLKELRFRIMGELKKKAGQPVSSKAAIAREFGVSVGFLNYKLPDEVAKLGSHRRTLNQKVTSANHQRAVAYLLAGPILEYPSAKFPSHDHLITAVVNECGLGVNRARRAVAAALTRVLSDRAYKKYRKANNLHKPRIQTSPT